MNKLEEFLRQERVWTKFKKNFKANKLDNKRKDPKECTSIIQAFVWAKTLEGHNFWHTLYNKS